MAKSSLHMWAVYPATLEICEESVIKNQTIDWPHLSNTPMSLLQQGEEREALDHWFQLWEVGVPSRSIGFT